MAWFMLIIAGLLEPVWATALKSSEGLTRFWPSVMGIAIALISLGLLSIALNSLPAGTAYAVWVGIGVCGVTLVGIFLFGETLSAPRLFFLILIVVGVIGLNLLGN